MPAWHARKSGRASTRKHRAGTEPGAHPVKTFQIVMPAASLTATLLASGVLAHAGHKHGAAKGGALK